MARARGFNITIDGLEELGADLARLERGGIRKAIHRSLSGAGGEALAAEMRMRVPVRTGGLKAGIGVHPGDLGDDVLVGYRGGFSGGAVVNAREQKGAWVESGTRPHMIRARDGGALAFNGGQWEQVMHPGQKGQRPARKAMNAAHWEVMADVVDQINIMIGGYGQ